MDDEPWYALRARNPHAPAMLRALAAKTRTTNQPEADRLEKLANDFDAWHRANPKVR